MKKYYYLFATLLVCLPIACNKDDEQEESPQTPTITYIKAEGNEEVTKASIDDDDATFTWNTNDRIAVWAGGYKISNPLASAYNATNSATFSFSGDNIVIEDERANFAIFPAKLVWDGSAIRTNSATNHDSDNMTITLPDTYTLEEVQGEVSPTPMIATNAKNGTLAFKHLCPLLRITVVNIPKQTKRIEFDFNDVNVQGEFTLSSVDPATTAITTEDGGTGDIITVTMEGNTAWRDQLVVNLPVPTGTYGNITITAYDAVSGGNPVLTLTRPIKTSVAWTPTRKASRKMTATLPVFTAANGKKVTFAPGNVQAVFATAGSTCTWKFADHQYDYVGAEDANNSVIAGGVSSAGTVDLFGWVGEHSAFTGLAQYGIHNSSTLSDYGNTVSEDLMHDWGELFGDGWRTPSFEDYQVILASRSASTISNIGISDAIVSTENGRFTRGYLMGTTHGMYVFPDNYEHPVSKNLAGVNGNNQKYWDMNQFTEEEWIKMEAAGVVFLPAAGYRIGTPTDEINHNVVLGDNSNGFYWTNFAPAENTTGGYAPEYEAHAVYFAKSTAQSGTFQMRRWLGASVRLIRDLN